MASSDQEDNSRGGGERQYAPPKTLRLETENVSVDGGPVRVESGLTVRASLTQVPLKRVAREASRRRWLLWVAGTALVTGGLIVWIVVGVGKLASRFAATNGAQAGDGGGASAAAAVETLAAAWEAPAVATQLRSVDATPAESAAAPQSQPAESSFPSSSLAPENQGAGGYGEPPVGESPRQVRPRVEEPAPRQVAGPVDSERPAGSAAVSRNPAPAREVWVKPSGRKVWLE